MHSVSATYTTIMSGRHVVEWRLDVNGVSYVPISVDPRRELFGDAPKVGCCISCEIDASIMKPSAKVPRMALLEPFARVTNGILTSEWIPKGKYFIDTRKETKNGHGQETLTVHGYDAMLKAEQDCPINGFPRTDISTVNLIASKIGVTVDPSVATIMNKGYTIQAPIGYSCREVLGFLAAAYAGNFFINDYGKLELVRLNGYPPETNYLINNAGYSITFGGDRILV